MLTDPLAALALAAAEQGLLPDSAIRFGIRRLCKQRPRAEARRARPEELDPVWASDPIAPAP